MIPETAETRCQDVVNRVLAILARLMAETSPASRTFRTSELELASSRSLCYVRRLNFGASRVDFRIFAE